MAVATIASPAVRSRGVVNDAAGTDSQRLAKNFFLLSAAEFVGKLLTYGAFTFLGRTLGPERYGSLEFVLALMVFFTLPVDFGLGVYGAREIAKDRRQAGLLLREVNGLRLLLSLGSFTTLALLALVMRKGIEIKLLLLIYGFSLFTSPALLGWFFQGYDRMRWVAATSLAKQGVFAGLTFLFLRSQTPLFFIGLFECVSALSVAAICLYGVRFHLGFAIPRPVLRPRLLLAHFRQAAPIGLSDLAWALLWYFATVLLGFVAPGRALGWFGTSHRAVMALHTFVWLYFFNLLPSISRCVGLPKEHLLRLMRRSLMIAAWSGIFVAFMLTILSQELLTLAYGPSFAGAAPLFSLLVWMMPVAMLSGHYRYALIAYNLQKQLFYYTALSALISVILCFALIPPFGAVGAAAGLLLALVINFGLVYLCARRRVAPIHFRTHLVRPLVAMSAALAVFTVLAPRNHWMAGAAAALTYFFLLVLLQWRELQVFFALFARKASWVSTEELPAE